MITQKSCGVIVYRKVDTSFEYLLLHHEDVYWNFPKGRQEDGETEMQTALREVAEETGITADRLILRDGFRHEYQYAFDAEVKDGVREHIAKSAVFFLGEVTDTVVAISHEHVDFGWFDYATALKRLYYQASQDSLKKAHQFLSQQQGYVI